MLEKPEIHEQLILTSLHRSYGLQVRHLTFLPLGADVNTAVYRAEAQDGMAYFLKLRKGCFEEITVTVPQYLHSQAIEAIIPPLTTRQGQYWEILEDYHLILYPFIEGKNGYETTLSDRQWMTFGAALRGIHAAQIPEELAHQISRETFSSQTRELVQLFQALVETTSFDEFTAAKTAAFMRSSREEINRLVAGADALAAELQQRNLKMVLCHADIHPGNLLVDEQQGLLKIVDWDNPIFAPKEHDLSLIGGMKKWNNAHEIELFYHGYETADIDATALAYYRHERILLDIAEFCKQLLLTTEGGGDREQSYRYFTGQFEPGHEVDLAVMSV